MSEHTLTWGFVTGSRETSSFRGSCSILYNWQNMTQLRAEDACRHGDKPARMSSLKCWARGTAAMSFWQKWYDAWKKKKPLFSTFLNWNVFLRYCIMLWFHLLTNPSLNDGGNVEQHVVVAFLQVGVRKAQIIFTKNKDQIKKGSLKNKVNQQLQHRLENMKWISAEDIQRRHLALHSFVFCHFLDELIIWERRSVWLKCVGSLMNSWCSQIQI